jgi:imidazolonepropionase-like amidohydrolase
MRFSRIIPCILISIIACTLAAAQTSASNKQIIIAADTVLDGKGGVLRNTRIVVEGSKILRIAPNAGPVTYDLRGLTVLPGWIDAHVHITWSFGPDGRNAGGGTATPQASFAAAANAWATLMAGFTTVQSVGSTSDVPLRDAIASGALPGPRILTSAEPLIGRGEQSGTPDEIRQKTKRSRRRSDQDLCSSQHTPPATDTLAGTTQCGMR